MSKRDRLKSLFSAFTSASPPPDKSIRLRSGTSVCRARPRWLWWLPTDSSKGNDTSHPLCISSSLFEFSCTDDQFSLVPHYIKRYRLFGDAIILKDFILENVANNNEKQKPFTLKRIGDMFRLRRIASSKTTKHSASFRCTLLPSFRSAFSRIRSRSPGILFSQQSTCSALFNQIYDPYATEVFVFEANGSVEKDLWTSTLRQLVGKLVDGAGEAYH
ncbi:hypothetical protein CRM22_001433 [Opisthorchis felineus]|uniref:PH domain-containing protein n=1 Tax=Opisthorchis felineus TaxID=147828 RepID=A0A4S2MAM2_OPIFE|nr:hypothetical protein CRM22_001433 [Opisthorchis felineus]